MQNLQYDVLSTQARDLLPVLLALVEDGPLKEKLSAWDCRYTPSSTGPIRVGVRDVTFGDNTGALSVTITKV